MDMRITVRRLGALSLALPLLLASCGGGASGDPGQLTNDGYAALGSGDHAGAVESFEAALADLEPGTPEFMRAKMGEVEALIHLDAGRAQDQFLAVGSSASEADYATIGQKMTKAGAFESAIAVLDSGMKRFSESTKLKGLIDQVKVEAEKSGDAGALDSLKGLGYL